MASRNGRPLHRLWKGTGDAGRSLVPLWLVLLFALSACVSTQGAAPPPPAAELPKPVAPPPVALTPMPPPGPQPLSQAPTGSLWSDASGSLFRDVKAHRIGDIVTITVSEESKASKIATTAASRDKSYAGQMSFGGVGLGASGVASPKGQASFGPLESQFSSGFKGNGATTKADSMTAYMTATVVDVLPNGNLFIRGSRWTKVNNEMQQIVLEGIIRPQDISRNNSILSQNIAEAKIFFVGKGPVSQQQKPGWLGQFIDLISPF